MTRAGWAALAVVVAALVARLGAAALLGDRLHFADEGVYFDAATRLREGNGLGSQYRSVPAYPIVVAAFEGLAPGGVLGVRAAQAVVTGVGAVLVMVLATRLLDRRAALVAGMLYALDPLLVVAGSLLYPEAIAAVLLVAIVLGALRAARRDAAGVSAAVGIALGVLAQLRPVALLVVPVVSTWIASVVAAPPRRRALHAMAVIAGCGLALAPWTYRNYRFHGALAPIATAGTRSAPVSGADVQDRGLVEALLRQACERPLFLATHVGREFLHFWELYPQRLTTDNPERRAGLHDDDPRLPVEPSFPAGLRDRVSAAASAAELGLGAIGLLTLWRRRRAEAVLLASVMLAFGLGYALFIGKMRYRITIVPLLLVLAAAGLARMASARRSA